MTTALENLTEQEREIYKLIQDYLSSNRIIEIDTLERYLKSILSKQGHNLNPRGIKTTIHNLLEKKVIVEGSRLSHESILENSKRSLILNYIAENPGVYQYQIVKDLDLPNHIVVWHLDVLQRFHFVATIIEENHTLFYINTDNQDNISLQMAQGKGYQNCSQPEVSIELLVRASYYLRNEKSRGIIKYLKTSAVLCSKTHIAKQLGMHPNTVKKYVEYLLETGLLRREKVGRHTMYSNDQHRIDYVQEWIEFEKKSFKEKLEF